MKKHYREENDCLNCGTTLEGHFCHNCGQENLQIKENFGHLMNHAISDYFHFDHQFFHTLKPLLFKPGKLTNEYMAGRRMQYLHPIKMYIFISLVFFVLLFKKAGNDKEKAEIDKKISPKEIANVKAQLDSNNALTAGQKKTITDAIAKASSKTNTKEKNTQNQIDGDEDDGSDSKLFNKFSDTDFATYDDYLKAQNKLPEEDRDGFFMRMFKRKMFSYKKYGDKAKEIFLEDFKHNVPKMMFLLLPLFALILKASFISNHKYYVEHLIFSFHFHSFLFLLLIFSMLLQLALPNSWGLDGWVTTIVTFWIVWYIFKAFKVVYQRSNWRTVSKMMGIGFSYSFVFALCMGLLVVITALV